MRAAVKFPTPYLRTVGFLFLQKPRPCKRGKRKNPTTIRCLRFLPHSNTQELRNLKTNFLPILSKLVLQDHFGNSLFIHFVVSAFFTLPFLPFLSSISTIESCRTNMKSRLLITRKEKKQESKFVKQFASLPTTTNKPISKTIFVDV